MAQPDEMPKQQSVAGVLPLGRAVVVRSHPFEDMRPFIEHLWKSRTNMCRNIYPDEFPRGTKEKHATKEEEDEFILCYFSAGDLREQGGRFLKQVLYSIAKYNEDNVLSRAAAWAEQYDSFYANPGMSTSQIRNVLDEHQGAYFPDSFLCRAVLVINYGLKQLRDLQNQESANSTPTEGASPPQADLQRKQGPVQAPQHEQTFFDAARQASFVPSHLASNTLPSTVRNPQQNYMAGLPQSEHIRYGPSLLHGQSCGGRATASRQSQRQEIRGRHRRSSGSMHSPQLTMGPMVPLQQMIPSSAATGFPDFDPGLSGFVDALPGYPPVSYQMPLDGRFAPPSMHANVDFYSPISYARAPKPRMPLQIGKIAHQSTNGPGYYTGDADAHFFQNQIPGSFNQQGSRPNFPQPPNSPRLVDPHSFSRFSEERFSNQRPYALYSSRGGHRSSFNSGRTRRSSIRSGDGWQGRNFRQSQASSVPDNDPDWSCGPDFIGHRRVDVNTLVVTNLPPDFSVSVLQGYISRVMNNNKRLVVTCNNTLKSIAFVRFSTHLDAKQALGIRNLTFEGVPVAFKVPFKFWKSTDGKYFSPAHARQCIESGEWSRSRIGNYGSSAGGDYQSRESGRSEPSATTSEVEYQLQAPQLGSGDAPFNSDLNVPVFEDSAASDASETAAPSSGYKGPVLPSLSEASTPQKHSTTGSPWKSPRRNRIITAVASSGTTHSTLNDCRILDQDAGVGDDQASETELPTQIEHTSASDVTSTGATPVTEYVSVESASPFLQHVSSAVDAAMIEDRQVNKESLTADYSTISDSDKRGDSSPKEDADDSFQTAAETPEASTRVFTPRSTPVETKQSGVEQTYLATPTPKFPDEKTTQSPASVTESDDTTSISTAGQSLVSIMQASEKTLTPKSGPKQTESLSPFARQAQAKKKDIKSRFVKLKNKTKTDLGQVKQAKTFALVSLETREHGEKQGPKPVESKREFETELEQSEQTGVENPAHANPSGDHPRHSEDRGTTPVVTTNETELIPVKLEETKTDPSNGAGLPKSLPEYGDRVDSSSAKSKDETKTMSDDSQQAKTNAPSNAILTDKCAVHSENNGLRKSEVKVDEGKHEVPTILQPRDVVSRGDQKTLSKLSSVTALLTGALSSIGSSKMKTEIGIPKTSQLGENELTVHTSGTVQSDDGGESTTTTQPEVTDSTITKKPKKNRNKKKKKSKNTAPVRDEDGSSTETLAHETPAGSPVPLKASVQPHYFARCVLSERTNTLDEDSLDNHLSSLGIREGSIIELGPNSIGYRATNAGSIGEKLSLRGVEGEVEKSRRRMQEMDEKERLLKLRRG